MNDNHTLKQWLVMQENGDFDSSDIETQINAGWYDWFCSDQSLSNRLKKMTPKVKRISASAKINPFTMYVFFKNNCPIVGKLYDDFRICDIETGDVLWTVVPSSGYKNNEGASVLWGRENDFKEPLVEGSLKDIYNYFGV